MLPAHRSLSGLTLIQEFVDNFVLWVSASCPEGTTPLGFTSSLSPPLLPTKVGG